MKRIIFVLFLLVAILPFYSYAQCNGYSKQTCLPKLNNYIHTGQLNSTKISPGEKVEFMMTFYQGQEYRIIVCAEETLENIVFKVRDTKRRLIYESSGESGLSFNFKVASTQQLIITLIVPETIDKEKNDTKGCISTIVGFKF